MYISSKTWIIIHVCYREIFRAPVCIADLKTWLGISHTLEERFQLDLNELVKEGLLVRKNGYIVRIGNETFIDLQPKKSKLTREIITKGKPLLRFLNSLPFVKFIGVSGSLAADNPTVDTSGLNEGVVDLDIYLVTSNHALWLFCFFERIFNNLYRHLLRRHFYCFNYITEAGFLEISNKSFFTATEYINLKPIKKNINKSFILSENLWIYDYYSVEMTRKQDRTPFGILSYIYWLPNLILYISYFFLRVLKRQDFKILKWLTFRYDNSLRSNYKRISKPRWRL